MLINEGTAVYEGEVTLSCTGICYSYDAMENAVEKLNLVKKEETVTIPLTQESLKSGGNADRKNESWSTSVRFWYYRKSESILEVSFFAYVQPFVRNCFCAIESKDIPSFVH